MNNLDLLIVALSITCSIIFYIFFKRYIKFKYERGELDKSGNNSTVDKEIFKINKVEVVLLIIITFALGYIDIDVIKKKALLIIVVSYVVFFILRVLIRFYKIK